MYLLGVDGGGTKIEFWLTDTNQNPLSKLIIAKNSNLKYVGAAGVIANLTEGLGELSKQFDLSKVVYAYLGIAECGNSQEEEDRKVSVFLENYFEHFTLSDDQYTCYRSLSDQPKGVLGIAGTGSAINLFSPEGNKINKSIGHGGRDFGRMLLIEAKYGFLAKESEIYQTVGNFLQQDPVTYYDHLSPEESIRGTTITQIPKALFLEAYGGNQALQRELDKYLVLIGGRWAHKLTTYCYANFGFRPHDEFDIVLTGGMWDNWQRILDITKAETLKIFPKAKIMHDKNTRPVVGCIKLAAERAQELKLI